MEPLTQSTPHTTAITTPSQGLGSAYGSNTTNATVPSLESHTPTVTPTPWGMRFRSAGQKTAVPVLSSLMTTLALVLLSGGAWDKRDDRHIRRKEDDQNEEKQ